MAKTKTNTALTLLAGLVIGFVVSVAPAAWAETSGECVCPTETAEDSVVASSASENEATDGAGGDWTPATSAGVTGGGDADVTNESGAGTTDGDGEETATDGVGGDDAALETAVDLSDFRLSELLPDPEGTDTAGEFIEVANRGAGEGDTAGWRIVNASGKVFVLPSFLLPPGGAVQFTYQETKIALVNGGATIRLERPDGSSADSTTYGDAPTGKSWARGANSTWGWNSIPTPGAENDAAGFETNEETPAATASAAATPTVTAAPETPAPEATPEIDIAVTEFLPRPDGGEEWVEVMNLGTAPAPLDGWKLDDIDGGSAPFALDGLAVPTGGFLVIAKSTSKIALNDDGDTVRLLAPDGSVRQAVAYAKAQLGLAYADTGDVWEWVSSTPGAANPVPGPEPAAEENAAEDVTGAEGEETFVPDAETPALLAATTDGKVAVTGTVTLPLGKQGKTIFALVDEDGRGYFVRLYGQPLPNFRAGDLVRVLGKMTERDGALTLSSRPADVGVLERGETFFEPLALGMLEPADQGRAVSVSGTVSAAGARWFTAADDELGSEMTIRLLNGKLPTGVKVGSAFEAKGVVRAKDGGVEILAELADVEFTPAAAPEEAAPPPAMNGQKGATVASWLAPLGGAGAAGLAWWRKRRMAGAPDLGLDA